jgi:hypothetical protein
MLITVICAPVNLKQAIDADLPPRNLQKEAPPRRAARYPQADEKTN